jgi:hypothetical protein
MNEVLSKLTGDQALRVLERLASGDAGLARTIEAAAKSLERGLASGFGRMPAGCVAGTKYRHGHARCYGCLHPGAMPGLGEVHD